MTRQDAQLLYDWRVRRYGDPTKENPAPRQRLSDLEPGPGSRNTGLVKAAGNVSYSTLCGFNSDFAIGLRREARATACFATMKASF
jgi:hypothetical protein